jgi:general secretion pathway protein I
MRRQRARGFTLLEVLVAVFVLAVALVAIVRSGGQVAVVSDDLRDQTLAAWVAANVIDETRLAEPWPDTGRRRGESRMGHRQWHWELTVSATEDQDLRRLDVRVYRERQLLNSVATLSGFIGQTGRRP